MNTILNEEDYEVHGDTVSDQRVPMESRLKGGMGRLFWQYQLMVDDSEVIGNSSTDLKKKDLEWMIKESGGVIVNQRSEQVVVVKMVNDDDYRSDDQMVVSHRWLLDSFSKFEVQNFDNYQDENLIN